MRALRDVPAVRRAEYNEVPNNSHAVLVWATSRRRVTKRYALSRYDVLGFRECSRNERNVIKTEVMADKAAEASPREPRETRPVETTPS